VLSGAGPCAVPTVDGVMTVLTALLAATPVSFDAALALAEEAPAVSAAQRAAALRERVSGRLTSMTSNPAVSLQPGVRTDSGATGPEGQVTVQQSFNLAGLAGARRDTAAHELTASRLELRGRRRELRVEVARAWLTTWALTEASRAVLEDETSAKELVQRIERVVASDGLTRVDLAQARAFAAEARALHLELEGQAVEAGGRLASLLGLEDVATVVGPVPAFAAAEDVAPSAAAGLPGVRRLEALLEAERSRGVEASAQYGTGLQLQVQGGHEAVSQWYGNVSLGVTLPLFDVGLRERAAHEATAALLEGERDKARAGARVELALLRHELEHTAEVYAVVNEQQLPAAREAAALQARRFLGGECTLQELLVVRRLAVTARVEAIRAEAALLAARATAREVLAELAQGGVR
jgi:cobalt-zinc-cadmium efflux system outer membrane protein